MGMLHIRMAEKPGSDTVAMLQHSRGRGLCDCEEGAHSGNFVTLPQEWRGRRFASFRCQSFLRQACWCCSTWLPWRSTPSPSTPPCADPPLEVRRPGASSFTYICCALTQINFAPCAWHCTCRRIQNDTFDLPFLGGRANEV
jgi:hypothetical protein